MNTDYPRFPGDVDPLEPHPILILNMVRDMGWAIRPAPGAWHLNNGTDRYAIYFDETHRFVEASGQGVVFDPADNSGAAVAAMLRTFLDWVRAHHGQAVLSELWLRPDGMFIPTVPKSSYAYAATLAARGQA